MRIKMVWFLMILSVSCAGAQPELRDGCNNTREIKDILNILKTAEETAENIQTILESADCSASTFDFISNELSIIESRLAVLSNGAVEPCCAAAQQAESLLEIIASKIPTIGSTDCCSQIDRLFSILEEVDESLDSKIEHLVPSSCCEQINEAFSLVQVIDHGIDEILGLACAPTLITTPTTILVPGNYCLANDITGPVAIGVSDISLDLNGFTIRPVSGFPLLISGVSNVTVRNGTIFSPSGTTALAVGGCVNVAIEDLIIELPSSSSVGIDINTSSSSVMVDSVTINSGVVAVEIRDSSDCIIRNSLFTNYSTVGLFIQGDSSGNTIENCVANGGTANGVKGFWLDAGVTSNVLIDCVAMNNKNPEVGNSNLGFLLGDLGSNPAGDNNCLIRCIADANDLGFGVAPATGVQLFKECIASNNIKNGFAEMGGTSSGIQYISNTAKHNGDTPADVGFDTNYNGTVITAGSLPYHQKLIPSGSSNPVSYWSNVTIP